PPGDAKSDWDQYPCAHHHWREWLAHGRIRLRQLRRRKHVPAAATGHARDAAPILGLPTGNERQTVREEGVMNWLSWSWLGDIPLLVRRRGRDIKKKSRTSFEGADGVVNHKLCSSTVFRNMTCERPPRLRRFGGSATFSYCRSHPSSRGGDNAS